MSQTIVFYSDDESELRHQQITNLLTKLSPLYCYYCGHILLKTAVLSDNTVTSKCSHSGCRRVSVFIEVRGKLKLLTAKTLAKLTDEELYPYSRADMLLRTIETKKIINGS